MSSAFQVARNLEDLIVSDDPKVREEAVRFLGSVAVKCIHQLNSKEPSLQRQAWHQWRGFRALNAIDALIDACDDDPAAEVRQAAQFAIDTIICETAIRQETQH